MQLQLATRQKAKIKMALQGPAGAGKTYGALLLGYGLTDSWDKIGVIDTENGSSNLYAHLGSFKVMTISAPFTPEKYSQALSICIKHGLEVIIIDSISHEWEGSGGILDSHAAMAGNSFTNWSKVTPRHNAFVQAILQAPVHIVCTLRTKQDYVLTEKNGKMVPEKVGLKSIQRDGTDYEFTLVFDLDIKNNAVASKDRTGLFFAKPECKLTVETGQVISDWCNQGTEVVELPIEQRINDCRSIEELLALYKSHPEVQQSHLVHFTRKRNLLNPDPNIIQLKKQVNGTDNSNR
jgi:hypothetical protein